MVEEGTQQEQDSPLPPELERFVVDDTMLFEVYMRGLRGQPVRFDEGGMVMDTTPPAMEAQPEERELLRQMSDMEAPPSAFMAWLDNPGDLDNEIAGDLVAAYQANPQSAPMLYQLLKGLAREEPESIPPSLLGIVGGGATTGKALMKPPTGPGPMIAKRPEQSRQFGAAGKRMGGPPMPPR